MNRDGFALREDGVIGTKTILALHKWFRRTGKPALEDGDGAIID
ncbi:MAG: hypothetical protein Q4D79_05705 [Propionibacteriaceae bacterium]|nr:hypothetical protein [Propionibacteriaceae bacterium]